MKPPQLIRLLGLMDQAKHVKVSTRTNDEVYIELDIITTLTNENELIADDLPEGS